MCVEVIDDLVCNVADRTHCNDHAVCIGSSVVVEELVVCTELGVDLVHVGLDDCGQLIVELVAGFPVLEEDVSVLVASSHVGMLGIQSVLPELLNGLHVAHVLEIVIVPDLDLLDFVAGSESVEEVDERNLAGKGCQVGYR